MEKSNTKGDGVFMKKIIMLIILAMTVVGCELFDSERWARINREDAERGRTCYKDQYGNVSCENTK